jgi:hypothetical protein
MRPQILGNAMRDEPLVEEMQQAPLLPSFTAQSTK